MISKLTTGVRDQKAAGSNPATSTRVKPLDFQGFFCFNSYAVLTFEGSFLLKTGVLSQGCHKMGQKHAIYRASGGFDILVLRMNIPASFSGVSRATRSV